MITHGSRFVVDPLARHALPPMLQGGNACSPSTADVAALLLAGLGLEDSHAGGRPVGVRVPEGGRAALPSRSRGSHVRERGASGALCFESLACLTAAAVSVAGTAPSPPTACRPWCCSTRTRPESS